MYMTIYKIDGLYHQSALNQPFLNEQSVCGKTLFLSCENRRIGQDDRTTFPDPPIDEYCEVCWPHIIELKKKRSLNIQSS